MIPDYQTNTVYLADALRRDAPAEFKKFRKFLENLGVTVKILSYTNDMYCRDYMPVQVDERTFVQFVFNPEKYFKRSELELITNPVLVCLANKLSQPNYSKIILDGGNVVKWKDKVIVTDQVYIDNRYQFKSDDAIFQQLEEELKCRVIIIPCYPGDKTGHADGMVRFIDESNVFINESDGMPKKWLSDFRSILDKNEFTVVELPCPMKPDRKSADGLYINFLQIGNLIVVPQFRLKEDDKALQTMNEVFGETNKVVPYQSNRIAEYGGVLNCLTWTLYI